MNLIPGERFWACPHCAAPTIVRDRVYTADGYPYVHECPPIPRKVPNERDFCVCGTLTWGGLCDECKPQPVKQAPERVSLTRLSDGDLAQRIERGGEGTSAAKAEAKRRIQEHERDERERKRRAL